MDGFYRGVETSLLALSLALGIGALAVQPRERPPEPAHASLAQVSPTQASPTQVSVTLPMLTVTADAPSAR
ncbi:hypothetical protein [Methylobacterium oxalidis]|uniref:hypothetical protein n=1 Tax=Methylobacterium oxalidis TaxID=944322 RepID=UPI003314C941